MKNARILLALVLLPMVLPLSAYRGASNESPLDSAVVDIPIDNLVVLEAVSRLLLSNHIAGGIVYYGRCDARSFLDDKKYSYNISGLTVRKALVKILSYDHDITWLEQNDSVVIFPSTGMPELLKTTMNNFSVDHDNTLGSAVSDVYEHEDVKKRLEALNIKKHAEPRFYDG